MKWETESLNYKKNLATRTESLKIGSYWNSSWGRDPKSVLFMLSRYKFISKLIKNKDSILEIGCGEGLGAPMLSKEAKSYTGIDRHKDLIEDAKSRLSEYGRFEHHDVLDRAYPDQFDICLALDVVEHIYPEHHDLFMNNIARSARGMIIIGSPSAESQKYASEVSRAGHVGCLTAEEQRTLVERYTKRTICFSMNDEVVHTGYSRMSHYNFCLGFL